MGRRHSLADITYGFAIGAIALLAVVIIVTPVIVVVLMSFTDHASLNFPPTGFSLQWYRALFDESQSRQIHRAAGNTLEVAALSTLFGVGTELGFQGDSDLVHALRQSTQMSTSRAGDQLVTRNLNVQPTIRVRPGWPLRVIVHRDLVLRPWQ